MYGPVSPYKCRSRCVDFFRLGSIFVCVVSCYLHTQLQTSLGLKNSTSGGCSHSQCRSRAQNVSACLTDLDRLIFFRLESKYFFVISCYQLLFVVISCYLLLSVVICCYPLLFVVICCYPLLFVVISTMISTGVGRLFTWRPFWYCSGGRYEWAIAIFCTLFHIRFLITNYLTI